MILAGARPRTWPWARAGVRFLAGAALAFLLLLPAPRVPFWFDEVYSANLVTFQASPGHLVLRVASEDAHPPLYYLLLYGYARATGFWGAALEGPPPGVEPALRLPSMVLSALSAGLAAALLPPQGALVGGLLLLGSPPFLLKAWEARMYPLLGFFLLLAAWALLARRPYAFALAGTLALYTHYLAALALFPPALVAFLRDRKAEYFLPWILFLLWAPFAWRQVEVARITGAVRGDPIGALFLLPDLFGTPVTLLLLVPALLLLADPKRDPAERGIVLAFLAFPVVWWLSALVLNTSSPRYFGAFAPLYAYLLLREWSLGLPRLFPFLLLPALALFATARLDPPRPGSEPYPLLAHLARHLEDRAQGIYGNERGRLLALRYYYRGRLPIEVLRGDRPLPRPALVMPTFPNLESGFRLFLATQGCHTFTAPPPEPFFFRYCPYREERPAVPLQSRPGAF